MCAWVNPTSFHGPVAVVEGHPPVLTQLSFCSPNNLIEALGGFDGFSLLERVECIASTCSFRAHK